jgi:NhaA family Na+:H+ antiporter
MPPPPERPPVAEKLPARPVEHFTRPVLRFLHIESASGIALLVCTVVALVLANSPAAPWYQSLWKTPVALILGGYELRGSFGHLVVSDVLMTIFFFLVGLEIKRELVAGELNDPRKAALPVVAALGGMLVPAGLYMAMVGWRVGEPEFRGWGIPMATDIAFVVGILALLGQRIPFGLKILLLSLAIADDIAAVVVIAVFYSSGLNWTMLGLAGLGLVLTSALNRLGVRSLAVYIFVGIGVWLAFLHSGVHPTMTGVLLGLLTPAGAWIHPVTLTEVLQDVQGRAQSEGAERQEALQVAQFATREAQSPLERLEAGLHPWVGFLIMPLFALANAGVHVEASEFTHPVALAVGLGLFLGKPAGVVLFSYLSVRIGLAKLPEGVSWGALVGGGCLAGIGFTMSLFVAGLAFRDSPELLAAGKFGTLAGSVCSAVLGTVLLIVATRHSQDAAAR